MEISHPMSNKVIQKVQGHKARRTETVEAFSKLHQVLESLKTEVTPKIANLDEIRNFQNKVDEVTGASK